MNNLEKPKKTTMNLIMGVLNVNIGMSYVYTTETKEYCKISKNHKVEHVVRRGTVDGNKEKQNSTAIQQQIEYLKLLSLLVQNCITICLVYSCSEYIHLQ